MITDSPNVITWSHAYSLLPYPTFILKRSFFFGNAAHRWSNEVTSLLRMRKEALGMEIESIDIQDLKKKTEPWKI
jgi:hypothetical protein